MTNDFAGGLRGLRPPATFFATLRVVEVSQLYGYLEMLSWSVTGSGPPGLSPVLVRSVLSDF